MSKAIRESRRKKPRPETKEHRKSRQRLKRDKRAARQEARDVAARL